MALEEFTIALHYQAAGEERQPVGHLSLVYFIKKIAQELRSEGGASLAALEARLSQGIAVTFAPGSDMLEQEDAEPPVPFLLGGMAPGLALEINDEGEPLAMQTMTYEQAEELRTYLNRALKTVADDPTEFDSPLLLGPDDAP